MVHYHVRMTLNSVEHYQNIQFESVSKRVPEGDTLEKLHNQFQI